VKFLKIAIVLLRIAELSVVFGFAFVYEVKKKLVWLEERIYRMVTIGG
jgi:hypothetical protein